MLELFKRIFESGEYPMAWESGEYPMAWGSGIIFQIFKGGDINDAKNCRGITIINIIEKYTLKPY